MTTHSASDAKSQDPQHKQVLVILAAHGEAENSSFREQFAVSWRTLTHAAEVMPLAAPLRALICTLGATRKALTGTGGSSHNAMTQRQAEALETALADEHSISYRVATAFASAEPGVARILASAPRDATVLLQSMIPTDSRLSCGLSCLAARARSAIEDVRPLARLWDDPELIAVHRDYLIEQLSERGVQGPADQHTALVIVLHGTLLADKSGQAPGFHNGHEEKSRYAELLHAALSDLPDQPWQRVEIAYLNHAVGGHWSQPELSDCLAGLAEEGIRQIYTYPAEHLVDSAETTRLAQVLEDSPLERGYCLACLNDSALLIDFLARRIRSAMRTESAQPCDHCPLASDGVARPATANP